jgi:hypothetical protein
MHYLFEIFALTRMLRSLLSVSALLIASSPLGDVSSCTEAGKVNLFGRRRSRQVAKDPFLKALLTGSCAPESIPAGIGNFWQKSKFTSELSAIQMLINLSYQYAVATRGLAAPLEKPSWHREPRILC